MAIYIGFDDGKFLSGARTSSVDGFDGTATFHTTESAYLYISENIDALRMIGNNPVVLKTA